MVNKEHRSWWPQSLRERRTVRSGHAGSPPYLSALAVAACFGLFVMSEASLVAADAAVSARLEIPEAEIHVIGDPIPLIWHFNNLTPQPLAFTWEACCRLNGRMTVRKEGVELPPIPPGPNSAHQFAKPAIIRGQSEQAFESQLADWVFLTNSGRYEISGRYIGVLPEQQQPVPRSIALWRGEVSTRPEAVTLVSVAEYLGQRADRVKRSGIDAAVTGPERLPALGEMALTANVTNVGSTPLNFRWPLEADLWFVDSGGFRVHRAPMKPVGDDEAVTLPPKGVWNRSFNVAAADLGGAAFGDYRVFVDFHATTNGRPRVASAAHSLRWSLGATEVATLLNDAARGSGVGARNAPLRVLRQYLGLVETTLASMSGPALNPKADELRKQLVTAARLRDLPTRSGRAELRIRVMPGGYWRIDEPVVARAVAGSPADQLRIVMAARRHLGLEVSANLHPDESATVRDVAAVASGLGQLTADMATAPRFIAEAQTNMVPGSLTIQAMAVPANLVVRLQRQADGSVRASVAKALTGVAMLKPEDLTDAKFTVISEKSGVSEPIRDGTVSAVQALVLASGDLAWSEVRRWLDPLLGRGLQIDLSVLP